MKRIFYIIDTLEMGGTERSLLDLTGRMDRSRFEPVVCSLYQGTALAGEFESAGVRILACQLPGKYQFVRAWRRLATLVRQERPDVIHTMLFRSNQVGRAVGRWLGVPVVSSFVGVSYEPIRLEMDRALSRRKMEVLRRLDAITARWVRHFHAVSHFAKHSNCRYLHVDAQRVTVIPRARNDMAVPSGNGRAKAELQRELNLDDAGPILLNVGRHVPPKGQRFLVDAMPRVLERFPRAVALIAGDGFLRDDLRLQAQRRGVEHCIKLLGWRDDVPALMRLADCYVFPSLQEGSPGALIEAMMAGLPIVATQIPSIEEVIDHRHTGLLVEPKSAALLADAVLEILTCRDAAARLGEAARNVALRRYETAGVVDRMQDLYDRVLCGSAKGWQP